MKTIGCVKELNLVLAVIYRPTQTKDYKCLDKLYKIEKLNFYIIHINFHFIYNSHKFSIKIHKNVCTIEDILFTKWKIQNEVYKALKFLKKEILSKMIETNLKIGWT